MDIQEQKKELKIKTIIPKKHNMNIAKGSVELIQELLEKADIYGDISVIFSRQITGSPFTKGIKVFGYSRNSVSLYVQPGENNTRRVVWVMIQKEEKPEYFFDKLIEASELIAQPKLMIYGEQNDKSKNNENTDTSLRDFTQDEENNVLALMAMKEKEQEGFIPKNECVDAILSFAPEKTPKQAAGPIIAYYLKNKFLKPVKEKGGTGRAKGYSLTDSAKRLISKYSIDVLEKSEEKIPAVKIGLPPEIKKDKTSELNELMEKLLKVSKDLAEIEKENYELKMELGELKSDMQKNIDDMYEIKEETIRNLINEIIELKKFNKNIEKLSISIGNIFNFFIKLSNTQKLK